MPEEVIMDETMLAVTEDSATSDVKETPSDDAQAVKGEDSATSEDETKSEPAGKKDNAESRIKKLVAKQHEAEREAAYWRGQAEAKAKAEEAKAPASADAMPTPDQYEDYDAYIVAKAQWAARGEFKAEQERERKKSESAKAEMTAQERRERTLSQADKAREKYEDFDDVISTPSLAKFTREVAEVIHDSDMGADIAYYLGKNPAEAERISRLSPIAAAREVGKLELKLSSPAKVEPKRITSANPPVETLSGDKVGAQKDPSKMSDQEWYEWDKAERAKKLSNRK